MQMAPPGAVSQGALCASHSTAHQDALRIRLLPFQAGFHFPFLFLACCCIPLANVSILHHSSPHSVNTHEALLRVGAFTDAGNVATREPDMVPALAKFTVFQAQ